MSARLTAPRLHPASRLLLGLALLAPAPAAQTADLVVTGFNDDAIHRVDGATGAALPPFGVGVTAQPGGLALDRHGRLYVADFLSDRVLRFDVATGRFLDVFNLRPIDGPWGLAFGPHERLYVASWIGNVVIALDANTGEELGVFAEGAGMLNPRGIAVGPDGDLFVASEGPANGVLRFDGATGASLGTFVTVPGTPTGVVFSQDGDLFVGSGTDDDAVHRFDGMTGQPLAVLQAPGSLDGPHGMAIGPDGHLYVCSFFTDTIVRFELAGNTFLDVFSVLPPGVGPAFLIFHREVDPMRQATVAAPSARPVVRDRAAPRAESLGRRLATLYREEVLPRLRYRAGAPGVAPDVP